MLKVAFAHAAAHLIGGNELHIDDLVRVEIPGHLGLGSRATNTV